MRASGVPLHGGGTPLKGLKYNADGIFGAGTQVGRERSREKAGLYETKMQSNLRGQHEFAVVQDLFGPPGVNSWNDRMVFGCG